MIARRLTERGFTSPLFSKLRLFASFEAPYNAVFTVIDSSFRDLLHVTGYLDPQAGRSRGYIACQPGRVMIVHRAWGG